MVLPLVKGSRFQLLHRSREVIPEPQYPPRGAV